MNADSKYGALDARVTVLEKAFESMHGEVITKLDALMVSVAAHHAIPICSKPNYCLDLEARYERRHQDFTERLDLLEKERERRIGERTLLATVSGIVGAGIVAFGHWFVQIWTSKLHN